MNPLHSLRDRWSGLQSCWKFSNRWQLILQRLLFRHYPIVTYLWKDRWFIVCDTRYVDHYSPQTLLADQEYGAWIKTSARAGACSYVNVGAHIGGFDVAVMDAAGSIPRAVSVELNPRTFAALQYNLAVNAFHTVRPLHAGVSGERGTIRFAASTCSLADSIFSESSADSAETVELPLITLQDALAQGGLLEHPLDLLKLDCEGAEYSIIRLSSPEILQKFRSLIMEIHAAPAGESFEALTAKLQACGFRVVEERAEPKLMFWQRVDG
jgi:FkbM family methyltransferase